MIKQAHNYLVGALSGATLIGIAIAVFVVLVSAQVFHELPIVNVSSPDQKEPAVSAAKAVPAGATAADGGGTTAKALRSHAGRHGRASGAAPAGGNGGRNHGTATERGTAGATGPASAVEGSPSTSGGTSSGGNSGSQPSSNSASQNPSSSSEGGSGSGTTSGSSGSNGTAGGSSGSSGSTGTGSGGTTTTGPVTAKVESASEELTGAINETVEGVDENLLGGSLEEAGVTEVTESIVEGVAGPESVVGKTVDGVTEAVNGLLGSGSR